MTNPPLKPLQNLKTFSSGIYRPYPVVEGLELETHLKYDAVNQTCHAVITNTSFRPLVLDHVRFSLAYSNFFGSPGKGGNHLNGFILTPSPEIPRLAPRETREVLVFGPDRPIEIVLENIPDINKPVAEKILAAESGVDFLRTDKTEAFFIWLQVGNDNYHATLHGKQMQP